MTQDKRKVIFCDGGLVCIELWNVDVPNPQRLERFDYDGLVRVEDLRYIDFDDDDLGSPDLMITLIGPLYAGSVYCNAARELVGDELYMSIFGDETGPARSVEPTTQQLDDIVRRLAASLTSS